MADTLNVLSYEKPVITVASLQAWLREEDARMIELPSLPPIPAATLDLYNASQRQQVAYLPHDRKLDLVVPNPANPFNWGTSGYFRNEGINPQVVDMLEYEFHTFPPAQIMDYDEYTRSFAQRFLQDPVPGKASMVDWAFNLAGLRGELALQEPGWVDFIEYLGVEYLPSDDDNADYLYESMSEYQRARLKALLEKSRTESLNAIYLERLMKISSDMFGEYFPELSTLATGIGKQIPIGITNQIDGVKFIYEYGGFASPAIYIPETFFSPTGRSAGEFLGDILAISGALAEAIVSRMLESLDIAMDPTTITANVLGFGRFYKGYLESNFWGQLSFDERSKAQTIGGIIEDLRDEAAQMRSYAERDNPLIMNVEEWSLVNTRFFREIFRYTNRLDLVLEECVGPKPEGFPGKSQLELMIDPKSGYKEYILQKIAKRISESELNS